MPRAAAVTVGSVFGLVDGDAAFGRCKPRIVKERGLLSMGSIG